MGHKEQMLREAIAHWRRLRYFCKPGSDEYKALERLQEYEEKQLEFWLQIKEKYYDK